MEIQFISVCLRAAEESSVTVNLQADGWKPAVCTADAAAPKTVQKFSTVSRRTCELNPTDFCEKTQLRHKQLDVPSFLRARRVPAGYRSEVMQAWLLLHPEPHGQNWIPGASSFFGFTLAQRWSRRPPSPTHCHSLAVGGAALSSSVHFFFLKPSSVVHSVVKQTNQ